MCVSATERGLLIALTAGDLLFEASINLVGGLIRLGLTMHQIVMILPMIHLYVSSYSSHCGYKTPHTYSLSLNKHMCSGNCELSVIDKNSLFTLAKRFRISRRFVSFQLPSSVITDESSQRLPKRLEIVNLLASVNEPQSCQTYLATQDCSKE